MALIERFTPGGNLYPDGESKFVVLVDIFRRMAENRDVRDAEIRAAWQAGDADNRTGWQAGDATTLSTAAADATGKAAQAEDRAKTYTNTTAADTLAEANAYTDASFSASGPGGATDDQVDAAVDRGLLGGRIAPAGRLPENGAQAVGKGELVLNVKDYGAMADGSTDDGPAISAAIAAAATLAADKGAQEPVTVLIPPGRYRVATTIKVRSKVEISGYGARIQGPITTHPRITTTTAAPAALDWAEQTAGAAFCDLATDAEMRVRTVVNQPVFKGLTLVDYRFGFVSRCFAWAHAQWTDVFFESCNLGIFAYQSAQHHQLKGVISGGIAGTTYAAAATCFASGHPSNNLDNTFCDGFEYDSTGIGRNASHKNDAFDQWFEEAIIRPATPSVVMGGTWTFPFTGTALKVSGRNIYVPVRNKANTHSFTIHKADALNCPRGLVLVGNLRSCSITNLAGEGIFVGTDGTESMLTILNNNGGYTPNGVIQNVDTTHVTGTGRAITVIAASGAAQGRFEGVGIWGTVVGREHFGGLVQDINDPKASRSNYLERRGSSFLPRAGRTTANIYDVGTDTKMLQPAPGDSVRFLDELSGMSLQEHFWSMTIPDTAGGARTRARISIEGSNLNVERDTGVYNGTLEVWARRLDTGQTDYGRYIVNVPQFTAVTSPGTLASQATSGSSSFTMNGKTVGYSLGQRIKIGADDYVLKGFDGTSVFTTVTPLRATYAAGTTVTSELTISTVQAMSSGMVVVEAASGRLQIRNAVTGAPPVQFAAKFSSLSAPR